MEDKILWALFGMNILQFLLWSRDHHKLVDKIMSRSYADYVQTKAYASGLKTDVDKVVDEVTNEVLDSELDKLNKLFS